MQQYLKDVQTIIRTYTGAPVPEYALEELLGIGTLQMFSKGELIIAAGEKSNILYILLQGLARKFYLDATGNDITHMFLQEYSFFSTDYVMIRQPSLCCFEAAEECRTLAFIIRRCSGSWPENRLCSASMWEFWRTPLVSFVMFYCSLYFNIALSTIISLSFF